MKNFLCVILPLLAGSALAAENSTLSSIIESKNTENIHSANIRRGDTEFNASFALLSNYVENSRYTSINLLFSSEYFFRDHLSLGGKLTYYAARGHREGRVGPSGKYYFFEQDRFAPFVGEAILYNHTSAGVNYWTNQVSFGFKYFILPSLAAASSLNWYHLFGRKAPNAYTTLNQISIEMGLAIHL